MFIPKLLAHRLFLLFITLIITAIIGVLMIHELQLVFSSHYLDSVEALKEDEEGIAILLVGFGVLLEGRHILQNWVAGEEVEATNTTHQCEYYGFVLLALGLFIEMFDQLTNLIHLHELTFWVQVFVNYPINIYALCLLIKVSLILINPKHDQILSHS